MSSNATTCVSRSSSSGWPRARSKCRSQSVQPLPTPCDRSLGAWWSRAASKASHTRVSSRHRAHAWLGFIHIFVQGVPQRDMSECVRLDAMRRSSRVPPSRLRPGLEPGAARGFGTILRFSHKCQHRVEDFIEVGDQRCRDAQGRLFCLLNMCGHKHMTVVFVAEGPPL